VRRAERRCWEKGGLPKGKSPKRAKFPWETPKRGNTLFPVVKRRPHQNRRDIPLKKPCDQVRRKPRRRCEKSKASVASPRTSEVEDLRKGEEVK